MKETNPDKARVHLRAEFYGANATVYTIPSPWSQFHIPTSEPSCTHAITEKVIP